MDSGTGMFRLGSKYSLYGPRFFLGGSLRSSIAG